MNDSASTILINSLITDIKNQNIKISTLASEIYDLKEVVRSMVRLIAESVEVKEEDVGIKTDS